MKDLQVETPAFVYDVMALRSALSFLDNMRSHACFKLLYSLKSLALPEQMKIITEIVDGFSASSYFEAKLAHSMIKNGGTVHFTTPGLRVNEIGKITSLCDFISFNSLSQWRRLYTCMPDEINQGLRINPEMSAVQDERYDPCRRHSKLGIPITQLINAVIKNPLEFNKINGLHFHSNSESQSAEPLLANVKHIEALAGDLLHRTEWINLGGGYSYHEMKSLEPFYEAVELLHRNYELDVYIEPGEAIVGRSGYIISSVLDIFENNGKTIAILDTTVNHMPEVFEFQYQPDISEHSPGGQHEYILAGSTCLAGDLFGDYRFNEPLEVGSRIIFENMGAYTLVKANMFNGINLPKIYSITEEGKPVLIKEFTYLDFLSRRKDLVCETV